MNRPGFGLGIARSTAAALGLVAALAGVGAATGPSTLHPLPSMRTAHAARVGETGEAALSPAMSSALQMTRLVNADRAAHGLRALSFDQPLTAMAQWRSEDMAASAYFSHYIGNVPGRLVFDVLKHQGVSYQRAGENLAENYFEASETAIRAEAALMNSLTHRANILGPDYTHLGVGVAVAPGGRVVYTQLFKAAW